LEGSVEAQFVRPVLFGMSVAPFRVVSSGLAVVPRDESGLISANDSRLGIYPGLASWWNTAERIWQENRSDSTQSPLIDWINWQGKLAAQFPVPPHRVVYTKAGSNLCAAHITDTSNVVDANLYWAPVGSVEEAHYLCGILNSAELPRRVRPLQARGQFGPRHFDLYVFRVPFPLYDPDNEVHRSISMIGLEASSVVQAIDLTGSTDRRARRLIQNALESTGVSARLDSFVVRLLEG
jgi:hypothetical protein